MIRNIPSSWSFLDWRQLTAVWTVKQRYGGNADVARAAALLSLCGIRSARSAGHDGCTGESVYHLQDRDGLVWTATAREIAHAARQAMPWFDYPYGDPGEPAEKDDKGKVVKEARDPVRGYVGPMRDALALPVEQLKVGRRWFALPQVACNNLTWHQYRSLQAIAPQLFREDVSDGQAAELQAQFLAHILTPRSIALLDTAGGSIRLRLHYEFRYDEGRAEDMAKWFVKKMAKESGKAMDAFRSPNGEVLLSTLFHICFQCYQTALSYYSQAYPLLFNDDKKSTEFRDALQGEVGTINTIMKYAGYSEQQQVYDSNLPFVLDILNTMTREAKEIERMNSKIKKK